MVKGKKAIILGTGPAQKDAVKYLIQTGWYVIGCSYRHEGPALPLVNRFELIDIRDVRALHSLAVHEGVRFVYSIGSDIAMPVISTISDSLDLPCFVPCETAELMQNKIKLREYLCSKNVSKMPWRKVSTTQDLEGWSTYPAVIKPACSQGQRGVFQVFSAEEASRRTDEAISHSIDGLAIIEKFLDGREMSANLFLVDGNIRFLIYSNRNILETVPGGIPMSHDVPSGLSSYDRRKMDALVLRTVQVLGLKNGPVYFQLKLTSDGPRLIEVTPRLDGCHLWRLIKMSTGVDLLAATFQLLIGRGEESLFGTTPLRYTLNFFHGSTGERFSKKTLEIPKNPEFIDFYYHDGDEIKAVNGRIEKIGYWISRGDPTQS